MNTVEFSREEIREITKNLVISPSSQIGHVLDQLFDNLNAWLRTGVGKGEFEKGYYESCIKDLISALRNCHPSDGYEVSQLFSMEPNEFEANIKDFDNQKQYTLKHQYDDFWLHHNIGSLLLTGDIKDYTKFEIVIADEVETVAFIYLSHVWMHSKLLDFLIIDSLVFAETIAFADQIDDLPSKKVSVLVWRLFKYLVKEALPLIFATIIAALVSQGSDSTFWLVFTGITVIRWLNPVRHDKIKTQTRPRNLLVEMIVFYDSKLKNSLFDASLLKELLFDVEKKGATYSSWIYRVLNKRLEHSHGNV